MADWRVAALKAHGLPITKSNLALVSAGFKGPALDMAHAVSMAESRGNPMAFNGNRDTGDQSYGLFQINMIDALGPDRRKRFGLASNDALYDPTVNARVAYRMSNGGKDWSAWSTFKNGAYKQYLKGGVTAAPDPEEYSPARNDNTLRTPQAVSRAADSIGASNKMIAGFLLQRAQQGLTGKGTLMGGSLLDLAQARQELISRVGTDTPDPNPSTDPGAPETAAGGRSGASSQATQYHGDVLVPGTSWKGTHVTDGLDWNHGQRTAEDIMASAGTPVGAPEDGQIVRWGSAQGGEAMYFQGASGRTYWLGHIDQRLPVGTSVKAGQPMAVISADHPRPHLHIDVKLGGK